tara:strand:- start:434 stop:586 length:153 start_codon:yes stop_codon:yes gene_type:complete
MSDQDEPDVELLLREWKQALIRELLLREWEQALIRLADLDKETPKEATDE